MEQTRTQGLWITLNSVMICGETHCCLISQMYVFGTLRTTSRVQSRWINSTNSKMQMTSFKLEQNLRCGPDLWTVRTTHGNIYYGNFVLSFYSHQQIPPNKQKTTTLDNPTRKPLQSRLDILYKSLLLQISVEESFRCICNDDVNCREFADKNIFILKQPIADCRSSETIRQMHYAMCVCVCVWAKTTCTLIQLCLK